MSTESVNLLMQNRYLLSALLILKLLLMTGMSLVHNAASISSSDELSIFTTTGLHIDSVSIATSNLVNGSDLLIKEETGTFSNIVEPATPNIPRCQGMALCLKGEVVKVIDGKTFYVNISNKIYKIELTLIGLPLANQQAMMAATTFTRNACLGDTVSIDQDDGQKGNTIIATVYCSPLKSLNAMLLDTGSVQLDRSQCTVSEFAKIDWAISHGC